MPSISARLRRQVEELDASRCAYCLTSRLVSGAQLHLEHIVPIAKGGTSTLNNLCLACAWCNSFKAVKTDAIDPITGLVTALFNPRVQVWSQHFTWDETGVFVEGVTATGRATIVALQMNNEYIVPARRLWQLAGWHPPLQKD